MTPPVTVRSSRSQPTSASGKPKTPAFADADTTRMRFFNRNAEITVPVASCKLERTIEGASSITVRIHDPQFSFLNCEAIKGKRHGWIESYVVLEGQLFAIAGLKLNKGHIVEVILEDEVIHRLRQVKTPLTMTRGSVTRAEFIKHMFAESGVPLISPELEKKQPIQSTAEAEKLAQKDKKLKPGISPTSSLTVKGQPADAEQRRNIEIALETAVSHNAGELAASALLEALIQENAARNPNILQLERFNISGDHVDPNDVGAVCALFLTQGFTGKGGAIALAKAHPSWNAGEVAQAVQGSAFPEKYGVWKEEATAMVNGFTGFDSSVLKEGSTYAKPYQFERRRGEDSWAAARRLAEEVGWYLFVLDGSAYFVSGKRLKASRPRFLVAPGVDGLISHPTFGYMTAHSYDDTVTGNSSHFNGRNIAGRSLQLGRSAGLDHD